VILVNVRDDFGCIDRLPVVTLTVLPREIGCGHDIQDRQTVFPLVLALCKLRIGKITPNIVTAVGFYFIFYCYWGLCPLFLFLDSSFVVIQGLGFLLGETIFGPICWILLNHERPALLSASRGFIIFWLRQKKFRGIINLRLWRHLSLMR